MIYTNFSLEAKKVVYKASQIALKLNASNIRTEHLIWGILEVEDVNSTEILSELNVNIIELKQNIETLLNITEQLKTEESPSFITIPLSVRAENIIKSTLLLKDLISSEIITPIDLLWCCIRNEQEDICRTLKYYGINNNNLLKKIKEKRNRKNHEKEFSEPEKTTNIPHRSIRNDKTPILKTFGKDLTKLAQDGQLDVVIGREAEIDRMMQILARRKKNNPILIGEAGVGKSAIIEGLALRISEGKVPDYLKDKKIISIEMGMMVAGTTYRGEFEERMKNLVSEVQKNKNIIIFFDEIHTLVGAGNSSAGLDAANILKPALARGEFQCIGTTTLKEYRQSIEKDAALERRFQKILVEATSVTETINILQKIKINYQNFHNVIYSDEAIQAAVHLSERYITDRMLPDKAIDAIDEAGAKAFLTNSCDLFHQDIYEITEQDIAQVISSISGVPVMKIAQKEKNKLSELQQKLQQKVVGQNQAVEKIAKSIKRNRTGLKDPNKPIGSFFFLGTTGVGKTQLAKVLAQEIFDSSEAIIRIDMSEYSEKFTISRLIGSPPGYVGYEQGGQLTEKVRKKPYSVILLDEIEKAHTDVFNILLQVLDDGFLTDSTGRRVDFKNTIIIMTSNTGVKQMKDFGSGIGFETSAKLFQEDDYAKSIVEKALKKKFPPEFLNRIDEIVFFNSLSKENISQIIDIELDKLVKRLSDLDFHLQISQSAKAFLIEKGYDKQYGARPLKRAIQRYVEDPLAEMIIDDELQKNDKIIVDYQQNNDFLDFSKTKSEVIEQDLFELDVTKI